MKITWLKIQTGGRQNKHGRRVELGSIEKQLQLSDQNGTSTRDLLTGGQPLGHAASTASAVQYYIVLHMFTCMSDHVTAFSKGVLSVILPIQYNRRLHWFSQVILNTIPLKNTR